MLLLFGASQPTRLLKNQNFQRQRPIIEFESGWTGGQVWKGLDQRPKYVNFADIVNQSE